MVMQQQQVLVLFLLPLDPFLVEVLHNPPERQFVVEVVVGHKRAVVRVVEVELRMRPKHSEHARCVLAVALGEE